MAFSHAATGPWQDFPLLITGASGFLGGHLLKKLSAQGARVFALHRPGASLPDLPGVHPLCHDGSTAHLLHLLQQARPRLVFHLASRFVAEHTPEEIQPLILSNLLFGTQLLEAMQACGATRLVVTGTSWQHFQNRDYSPVCLYAATKQAFEAILAFYEESAGFRAIVLSLFDTYGPDDRRGKLFSFLQDALDRPRPLQLSPGEQWLDLVHVEDMVEALLTAGRRLLHEETPGHEEFAVSSGHPLPLRQVVERFFALAGGGPPLVWGGRPYRAREVMVPWNRGQPLPGWTPRISLEEGITDLLARRHV